MTSTVLFSLVLTFSMLKCAQLTRQRRQNAPLEQYNQGLFVTQQQLNDMTRLQQPFFDRMFKLTKYEDKLTYTERCGDYKNVTYPRQGVELTECTRDVSNLGQQTQPIHQNQESSSGRRPAFTKRSTYHGCCETVMSFSVPGTVTDLYSGTEYTAKHLPASYQLLNLGRCAQAGAACSVGGICEQSYRVYWVLVDTPSGVTFVPTNVPSHCTCVYS